jgi:hypothetical protein
MRVQAFGAKLAIERFDELNCDLAVADLPWAACCD